MADEGRDDDATKASLPGRPPAAGSRSGPHVFEVIETRELRVVDGGGRTRAVVGAFQAPTEEEPSFGVELLDAGGRARVMVLLTPSGPVIAFDHAGNNVLELGVNDDTPENVHVGPYLSAADLDGDPVYRWAVEEDGVLVARHGGPTR